MDLNENKTNNPLVSVIVPTYNQVAFLSETLDSVLKQIYQNWECIIINDGSQDNTNAVAMEYCKLDNRFKYLHQENSGPSVARNNGINNCIGEYILPLDSDDLISKDYLKEAVEVFVKNPNIKLVYCKAELFGENSGIWNLPDYSYEKLLFENMIFCTAMYKISDYKKTNGYNPDIKNGLEDWDFWISLLNEHDIVYKIPKVHFFYRKRSGSRSSTLKLELEKIQEICKLIYLNHKEVYEKKINPIYERYQIKLKERDINLMKSSKFRKMRGFYLKVRRYLKI